MGELYAFHPLISSPNDIVANLHICADGGANRLYEAVSEKHK